MKRNKGITLIALVITIIVLLILAGVAISMLSGENGILRKAAEAKTKTEEAQKEESTILSDMEIDGYFIEKGSKYKCRYGYITGFALNGTVVEDTIQDLQDSLPDGYLVKAEDGTDNFTCTDEDPNDPKPILTTGLSIVKDGNIVARVVVFGDVDKDGKITLNDSTEVLRFFKGDIEYPKYQQIAMDVNHNGIVDRSKSGIDAKIKELNEKLDQETDEDEANKILNEIEKLEEENHQTDELKIVRFISNLNQIDQYRYATKPYTAEYETEKTIREKYIKSIQSEFKNAGYNITSTDGKSYTIRGIIRGTTKAGELKAVLPENTIIKCKNTELSDNDVIGNDTALAKHRVFTYDYILGNVIIADFE